MTETRHTPGPWRVGSKCDERGKTWIGGSNENGGAVLPYLAVINWPDHQDANAHLIAAAPDMLEALRGLEGTVLAMMDDPSRADDMPVFQKARAAIAKAEGNDT